MNNKIHNIIGNKYNRLTVVAFNSRKNKRTYWDCICDCGNKKVVEGYTLKTGHTKSCGCLPKEKPNGATHGLSNHKIYFVWNSMRARCYNPNNEAYGNYGGRGISVCDRWLNFELFKEDMFDSYQEGLTLERRDTNGNYDRNNCYWEGRVRQARNRRNNKIVTYNEVTATLADICEQFNVDERLVRRRIRDGWDIKEAIETPVLSKMISYNKRKPLPKQELCSSNPKKKSSF